MKYFMYQCRKVFKCLSFATKVGLTHEAYNYKHSSHLVLSFGKFLPEGIEVMHEAWRGAAQAQ